MDTEEKDFKEEATKRTKTTAFTKHKSKSIREEERNERDYRESK
jgi:hypothetical protein